MRKICKIEKENGINQEDDTCVGRINNMVITASNWATGFYNLILPVLYNFRIRKSLNNLCLKTILKQCQCLIFNFGQYFPFLMVAIKDGKNDIRDYKKKSTILQKGLPKI